MVLKGLKADLKLLVIDLPPGLDVCLGDTWLDQHKAVIDYENRCLLLKKGKRKYRLAFEHDVSENLPPPPPKPGNVCLLSGCASCEDVEEAAVSENLPGVRESI